MNHGDARGPRRPVRSPPARVALVLLGVAGRGPLGFAWVLPGLLLAMVVGIVFLGFVARLPGGTRRLVVAAGGLYLAGAVGAEAVSGVVLDAQGDRALYLLVTAAEEGLEMAGSVLLLLNAAMSLLQLRPDPGGGCRLATGVLGTASMDAARQVEPVRHRPPAGRRGGGGAHRRPR